MWIYSRRGTLSSPLPFSGFPCRRVSFLSLLYCSYTRVTVYHSRGVIVFRLMVHARAGRVQVCRQDRRLPPRLHERAHQQHYRKIFHPGVFPLESGRVSRILYFFMECAHLVPPSPSTRRNEMLTPDTSTNLQSTSSRGTLYRFSVRSGFTIRSFFGIIDSLRILGYAYSTVDQRSAV